MRKRSLIFSAMVFLGVSGLSAGIAAAQSAPVFDTELSNVSLTHSADLQTSGLQAPVTVNVNPPPSGIPSAFQLANTFNNTTPSGKSSTSAFGAVSALTNQFNAALQFKAGTGVTQTNVPGKAYAGPSALAIGVNTDWNLPTGFPSFGLTPVLFYTFPVGGVVGIGGRDRFTVNLSVVEIQNGSSTFLNSVAFDKIYDNTTGTAPLPFTDNTLTGSIVLNNGLPLPAGAELLITGQLEFRAKNDESPSSISLSSTGQFGVTAVPLPAGSAMGMAGLVIAGIGQQLLRRRARAIA